MISQSDVITSAFSSPQLQGFLSNIDYRIARTRQEMESSFGLVYKEYLKRGYVNEHPSQLRVTMYNALPQAATFVAVCKDEIVSTATLVPDSPLFLPMDEIYHEELNQLRAKGLKLCEITMLASNTELYRDGISLMLNAKKMFFIFLLFKTIFDYAKNVLGLDCICITVNPKHSLTYNFLLFKDIGGLKTYSNANGAPAVAKYLNLTTSEEDCKKAHKEGLYRMFFGKNTPAEKFSGKFEYSPEDLKYFFAEKSDVFKTSPAEKLDYIKQCYHSLDFKNII
ncbi:MAG: hypothetical protein PHN57_01005 [Candidatus Omnitrophica bacterium]|nr:hypothetical protein [Candidatus Omnitrophota bacterium]